MSRPPKSETERLRQAQEARNIVDKELKTMAVPKLALAQNRAAAWLGISPKTLRRRLADATVASAPEEITIIDCGEY